jgi:hypothetical protein
MGDGRTRKVKSENGANQKPSFPSSRGAAIPSPLVGYGIHTGDLPWAIA